MFLHEGKMIIQNGENYNLHSYEAEKISHLCNMVNSFSFTRENPVSKNDYVNLVSNQQWRKTQKAAKEVYDALKKKVSK